MRAEFLSVLSTAESLGSGSELGREQTLSQHSAKEKMNNKDLFISPTSLYPHFILFL